MSSAPAVLQQHASVPLGTGLNASFSLYLDAWRALAAILVLLQHSTRPIYSDGAIPWFSFGHEAVIVFFVLSGLVITFVYTNRESEPGVFFCKRLARLQPVLILAIIVTISLDLLGSNLWPAKYEDFFDLSSLPSQVLQMFFYLGDIWYFSERLGTNGVFWSLNYEFWYYVLFAAWVFTSSNFMRILLTGAVCLVVGPKILLLLPCWLVGVAVFKTNLTFSRGITFFAAVSLAMFLIWFFFRPLYFIAPYSFPVFKIPLDNSRYFINDGALACLFGVHLCIAKRFFETKAVYQVPRFVVNAVKTTAATSFTLYLCHQPMLRFFAAATGMPTTSALHVIFMMVLVFFVCMGLGLIVEPMKRPAYGFLKRTFLHG